MESASRVSVRHVDSRGDARDLVGQLVLAEAERIIILPAGSGPVEIARRDIQAMRRVPPRVVRPTSSVDDVQRQLAQAWPGLEQVRMVGWTLYLGDGFSQRANSAHATGDPGRPLSEALAGITGFYRDRGIGPAVQVARRVGEAEGALEDALRGGGWAPGIETFVMTRALAGLDALALDGLAWADSPDATWLAFEPSDHPSRVAVLTAGDARFGTLTLDGRPTGCVRLGLTDDWAVIGGVFVDPAARCAGHGRALTIGAMARARILGARFAALQVKEPNVVARSLYESLGFVTHHGYRYWTPVS